MQEIRENSNEELLSQNVVQTNDRTIVSKKALTSEIKSVIIAQSLQGVSITGKARALDLARSSVKDVVQKFKEKNTTAALKGRGNRRTALTVDQKAQVKAWVNKNCLITLSQLVAKVRESFNINVSKSTIDKILAVFNYTVKTIVLVPSARNSETTIATRKIYAATFQSLESETENRNIVFLDEVGFSVSTRLKRGRSARETSAYLTVAGARTQNILVCAAMARGSILYQKTRNAAFNGKAFKQSILEIKERCSEIGLINPRFLCDNARIHHYRAMMPTLEAASINIVYLPPLFPVS
ncbi:hypothetical protein CDIK_2728 [Cucumispora dikerogammari]|nr:hypothetical protein CDIK_2728 [Cucumispora dikerogammari]